jgi:hypothetical protein
VSSHRRRWWRWFWWRVALTGLCAAYLAFMVIWLIVAWPQPLWIVGAAVALAVGIAVMSAGIRVSSRR